MSLECFGAQINKYEIRLDFARMLGFEIELSNVLLNFLLEQSTLRFDAALIAPEFGKKILNFLLKLGRLLRQRISLTSLAANLSMLNFSTITFQARLQLANVHCFRFLPKLAIEVYSRSR